MVRYRYLSSKYNLNSPSIQLSIRLLVFTTTHRQPKPISPPFKPPFSAIDTLQHIVRTRGWNQGQSHFFLSLGHELGPRFILPSVKVQEKSPWPRPISPPFINVQWKSWTSRSPPSTCGSRCRNNYWGRWVNEKEIFLRASFINCPLTLRMTPTRTVAGTLPFIYSVCTQPFCISALVLRILASQVLLILSLSNQLASNTVTKSS